MAIPAKRRWIIYCGVAFALTLMAVGWAGGQDRADSRVAGASKAREAARPAPVSASTTEHVPELRLDRLGMRAPAAPTDDPFQARSWAPAPDPEAAQRRLPPPRPRPQAPPLPFTYMGKMVDGNTTVVFLVNGDRNYIARVGETLDGTYQVERIADNELVVTYLPLKSRQTLTFGGDAGSASAPAARPQGRGAPRDDEDDEDDDSAAKPAATSVPQFRGALSAAAAAGDLALALNAPSQAIVGQEFTVSLALPGRNAGASATIELVYDSAVLSVGGRPTAPPPAPGAAPPPDPGRAPVSVVAPAVAGAPVAATAVRFRVVANAPTTTTIRVDTLSSTDAAGRPLAIASPGTITVTIVDAQGAR